MRAFGFVLLVLLPFGAGTARAQSLAENLERARTAVQVTRALADDSELQRLRLEARTDGPAIRLLGTVHSEQQRARAEAVARGVVGGGALVNAIEVGAPPAAVPLPPPLRPTPPASASPAATTAPAAPAAPAPSAQRAAAAPAATYHQVRSGETLFAIARQHGTTVAELQRLNGIQGTNIRIGQRLRVR